jgi:hypothetical protein
VGVVAEPEVLAKAVVGVESVVLVVVEPLAVAAILVPVVAVVPGLGPGSLGIVGAQGLVLGVEPGVQAAILELVGAVAGIVAVAGVPELVASLGSVAEQVELGVEASLEVDLHSAVVVEPVPPLVLGLEPVLELQSEPEPAKIVVAALVLEALGLVQAKSVVEPGPIALVVFAHCIGIWAHPIAMPVEFPSKHHPVALASCRSGDSRLQLVAGRGLEQAGCPKFVLELD